jgi:3-oxo-5-alpha-steroid 4-dehydrogenase 1
VFDFNLEAFETFIWCWMALAVLVFFTLFFISAPYGRHERKGWGPKIPSRVGWILMEAPSALIMALCFIVSEREQDFVAWVFLLLWQIHYINRSFIFPFRCRTDGKTMPLAIAGMAILFNGVNAFTNGAFLFVLGDSYGLDWLTDPRFIIGLVLFGTGMFINISSDNILLKLRTGRALNEGYLIPQGGLFRWVSSPNYFGEILEWVGFAIATWSLPALAFAFWTIANLAPRAHANHRWYRTTFPDYPPERKALVPGVF